MNAMVPEFADGMFSLTGVGSVSGPVDTLFGTHILVVTRHREADRVTRADAEAGIREHLATKDRRIAMTALLTQLLSEASVRADASLLDKFGATAAQ